MEVISTSLLWLTCRHIWWNAGYFGCIHSVRAQLPKATTKQGELTNNFIAGAVGGTFGTLVNTPFVLSNPERALTCAGRREIAYPEYDSPAWYRAEIQLDIWSACCCIPRRRFPCAL